MKAEGSQEGEGFFEGVFIGKVSQTTQSVVAHLCSGPLPVNLKESEVVAP